MPQANRLTRFLPTLEELGSRELPSVSALTAAQDNHFYQTINGKLTEVSGTPALVDWVTAYGAMFSKGPPVTADSHQKLSVNFETDRHTQDLVVTPAPAHGLVKTSARDPALLGNYYWTMELGRKQYNAQLRQTSVDSNDARNSKLQINATRYGITDRASMSYYVNFGKGSTIDEKDSAKFFWLNGQRTRANDQMNMVIRMSPDFNTFAIINNVPPGKSSDPWRGDDILRERGWIGTLSGAPGGKALLNGKTAFDYMHTGWHKVEVYAQLNTPGRRDGILAMSIDGVVVLNAHNWYAYEGHGKRVIAELLPFGMYGGGKAPKHTFTVSLDNIQLRDDKPAWVK